VSFPLVEVHQVRNRPVLIADVAGFMISAAMYLFLPVLVEFVQIRGRAATDWAPRS
jgi:hypothetical protein